MVKRRSFVILIISLFFILAAISITNAQTVDSGIMPVKDSSSQEWTWTLDDEGTFIIDGSGIMPSFDKDNLQYKDYRVALEKAKKLVISGGITEISDSNYIFSGAGFEELEMQKGVLKLGNSVFSNCPNLRHVSVPEGMQTIDCSFFNCPSLESVEVHGDLFECDFFDGYPGRKEEHLLKEVRFADGCTRTCLLDFDLSIENIELSSSVKRISSYTYYRYLGESIVIPASVETLEDHSIYNCDNLKELTICGDIKTEGSAVWECNKLQKIIFKEGVTIIPHLISVGEWDPVGSVTEVVIPETAKTISDYAFARLSSLKTVSIPPNVTTIGDGAFEGCTGLTEIELPDGIKRIENFTFCDCTSLTSVDFPSNLESIGMVAFSNCTSLKRISLPPKIKTINDVFSGCYSLNFVEFHGTMDSCSLGEIRPSDTSKSDVLTIRYGDGCKESFDIDARFSVINKPSSTGSLQVERTVELADSVTTIGSGTYSYLVDKAIVIPDQVTTIKSFAIDDNDHLTSVTIGPSVREAWRIIGSEVGPITVTFKKGLTKVPNRILYENPYGDSYPLKKVILPDTVKVIGSNAFEGCKQLTSITLPQGVTTLGDEAFRSCMNLKSINLPSGLKKIGDGTFSGCYSIKKIDLPKGLTTLGESAFEYTESLSFIEIPGSVKKIPKYCFDMSGIKKVKISKGIKSIGAYAFYDCRRLTAISIPNSVTTIGKYAFRGCNKMKKLTVGRNVKKLGYRMVWDCKKLKTIIIKSKKLKKSNPGYHCLEQSYVKTIKIKVGSKSANRKYIKKYKKSFTKKKVGKTVKVK